MAPKRPIIFIGTSGSHNYLKPHENDNKRFWPVVPSRADLKRDLSDDERAALDLFLARCADARDGRADLPTDEHDESRKARPDDSTKTEY